MTTTLYCPVPYSGVISQGYTITQAGTAVPDNLVGAIIAAAYTAGVNLTTSAGGTPAVVQSSSYFNAGTGAPTSGSWSAGMEVRDSTGAEFVCTASGTPGTWVAVSGGGGGAVSSVAGKTGTVTLVKADVGLGNVDNTADTAKPISTAVAASLADKAGVGLAEKNTIRSYVVIEMNADPNAYTFPARIRPVEPSRKLVLVENIGTTVIQLAYSTAGNVSWSSPATGQWTAGPTLQPGQAWRDTGTAQSLFMRPFTSGQSAAIGVYTELGVL